MIIDGFTIKTMIDNDVWQAYRGDQKLKSSELKIGPNSVDLTLGGKMLKPSSRYIVDVASDKKQQLSWTEVCPEDGKFFVRPGEFMLAMAQERFNVTAPAVVMTGTNIETYYVAPMFEGRSTMARLGLAMHVTAGFGDYGFEGNFTMELVNHGPLQLVLTVGMRIAQLSFQSVTPNAPKMLYDGAYKHQNGGPYPPVLGRDRFF